MAECPFQRARSPEQKAERRAQILAAAATFFEQERFEAISLASIARKAGVTKAALYRYFSSKEALFLGLYLDELEQVSLTPVNDSLPLWQALSELLVARPLFCRLTAILHSVLEQNLEEDAAREFKQSLLSRFTVLAQRIQQAYDLTGDQAATYLMQVQQTLIGCWAVSHPAPVVEKILDTPGLDLFRVDFKTALQAQLKALEMAL
ncbi:TetR/AcrR family transcriptional regulator [Alcanivorax sp.]|uniref:TetR/AcrR family transcriptional regulator n=1 Tax=Alcanivorax sp. TaxID=1872427 RepID=UPI000C60D255|nr:TetR/AcrR family transcriptional regulator [Alcanivorax sp.]MBU86216.1 TetR family transcriptional regulator [Alcanivorax sp.]